MKNTLALVLVLSAANLPLFAQSASTPVPAPAPAPTVPTAVGRATPPAGAARGGARGGRGMMGASPISNDLLPLFGNNTVFTANMISQTDSQLGPMTVPAKISMANAKSVIEMDMTQAQGGMLSQMPPDMLQSLGMDKMVFLTLPEKKVIFAIYPSLKSYLETPVPEITASASGDAAPKIEIVELAKESVDGQAATKNKVTITNADGAKTEYTVWNASELKNFPVKIVRTSSNAPGITLTFKNVKFDQPDAKVFELPAGFTKYDDPQVMMQASMARMMGGMPAGFGGPGALPARGPAAPASP